MDLTHDLSIFYAAWPAQDVLWLPTVGQGCSGRAIFTEPGSTQFGGEVATTDATLQYPRSTFPNAKQGDRFVLGGSTFVARENAVPMLDGLEDTIAVARVK